MVNLRSSMIYFIVCQLICLGFSPTLIRSEATIQQKAFYMSENNCDKVSNGNTGPPILYGGSDVVLLGKAKEIVETYGPNSARYSMKVSPQCLMRGNTSENEIVVRNLGKTKCGASNVEVNGNYLFFLRRTSDPNKYEALNFGTKQVTSPILWVPLFPLFCGIGRVLKCKAATCPEACKYQIPEDNACILTAPVVIDAFRDLYPFGFPTTTVAAPTTTTNMEKEVTNNVATTVPNAVRNMNVQRSVKKDDATAYTPNNKGAMKAEMSKGATPVTEMKKENPPVIITTTTPVEDNGEKVDILTYTSDNETEMKADMSEGTTPVTDTKKQKPAMVTTITPEVNKVVENGENRDTVTSVPYNKSAVKAKESKRTTPVAQIEKEKPGVIKAMKPAENNVKSAEANGEQGERVTYAPVNKGTPKIGEVKGTTGQAGLDSDFVLILSTVCISLILSL